MNTIRLRRLACLGKFFCVLQASALLVSSDLQGAPLARHVTGEFPQWQRKFFGPEDGLPARVVKAVVVFETNQIVVSTDKGLAQLEGNRFTVLETPFATASALHRHGHDLLAAGTNRIWRRRSGSWAAEADSPARVIAFAAEPGGTVWAMTAKAVWRLDEGWKKIHSFAEDISQPLDFLPLNESECYVASDAGLFGLMGKRKYWLELEARAGGLLSRKTRALGFLGHGHFLVATDRGLNLSNGTTGWSSFTGTNGLPILELTFIRSAPSAPGASKMSSPSADAVWFGSDQGLVRWHQGSFGYYAGKRWLPDDKITALAVASDGSAWAGTSNGLAHLFSSPLTLAKKAGVFQQKIEQRDRRHGYVTQMYTSAPGVTEGAQQELSDNDGLWTALYIASQSYRYALTKDAAARAQAWRSMQALLNLERLTGIPGFPARAVCRTNEPQFTAAMWQDPEWHRSTVQPDWFWKGDTSSDEIDGHYFGWYLFSELAADEDQKKAVRETCERVTDHILDHGYYLVDHDDKPTTWGVWAPEKLNNDPKWWAERGLNSLEILSHLRVAIHLVNKPRYREAYDQLIRQHHYALNTLHAKIPEGVAHDNQLLFLAYYPLLQLETDSVLRGLFLTSLRRTWELLRSEGSPLWNFIYGASTGEPCDVEMALEALRDMPLDLVLWKTLNSQRKDLVYDPAYEKAGLKRLLKPLRWTERVIHKWDHTPFVVDGGNDYVEADPTIWLLPFWMGRYHQLIE